jgi:hypothetical protein
LFLLAFLVSGYAIKSLAASPDLAAIPLAVAAKVSLTVTLEAAGATVETGESVSQAFFMPDGSIIKVNGATVQVFEYESPGKIENEASQVSSDGGSIGTSMVALIDAPHFYKVGGIIVLYVGSDAPVLDLLEGELGSQFAGR